MKQETTTASDETMMLNSDTVIGLFRLRGTTLKSWCQKQGIAYSTAQLGILGLRKGPTARRVVRMIRAELGL
jgi:hypothetical protein